jgi:Na+/alanine symporter
MSRSWYLTWLIWSVAFAGWGAARIFEVAINGIPEMIIFYVLYTLFMLLMGAANLWWLVQSIRRDIVDAAWDAFEASVDPNEHVKFIKQNIEDRNKSVKIFPWSK